MFWRIEVENKIDIFDASKEQRNKSGRKIKCARK